jgi:hypothetical protein
MPLQLRDHHYWEDCYVCGVNATCRIAAVVADVVEPFKIIASAFAMAFAVLLLMRRTPIHLLQRSN